MRRRPMVMVPWWWQRPAAPNKVPVHPNTPAFHARTRAGLNRQGENRGCDQKSGQYAFVHESLIEHLRRGLRSAR
jgi:hypothetical protein